jgi:hypothetical protein
VHKANKLSPAGSLEGAVRAFYGPWDSGVKSSLSINGPDLKAFCFACLITRILIDIHSFTQNRVFFFKRSKSTFYIVQHQEKQLAFKIQ